MCGRNSLFHPQPEVEERFGAQFALDYEPRYNIVPEGDITAIPNENPETVDAFQWGVRPALGGRPGGRPPAAQRHRRDG